MITRVYRSRFITEIVQTDRVETYTDEPTYSVITVVNYVAPFSKTVLNVWEKHRCTLQFNNRIESIVATWKSNNVSITLLPTHWGKPFDSKDSWGKLRIRYSCYGILNETEVKRIKALGAEIRKQITILARDLA
jgi:hypothetical protein